MIDPKEEVIDWLRDAYAMERNMAVSLEKASQNDRYTVTCRAAAAAHLTETLQHAQIVESLLRSLGVDVSSFRTGLGVAGEVTKDLALSHDQLIRELLAGYAMEHFEMVCYEAIAAAADAAGLPKISDACKQIVPDEARMAEAIRKELPRIVEESVTATPKAA